MARVSVKKSEDKPESKEVLASAIVKIGDAMDSLLKSGINRRAIVVLIQHETKLPMRSINDVIDAMKQLKCWYCK